MKPLFKFVNEAKAGNINTKDFNNHFQEAKYSVMANLCPKSLLKMVTTVNSIKTDPTNLCNQINKEIEIEPYAMKP